MFTGIVKMVGMVDARRDTPQGAVFEISGAGLADGLVPGDSVAVNGVCLTAEVVVAGRVSCTAVAETLKLSTLGELAAGSAVNIETAATLQSALGGHLVQGHVDGTAKVRGLVRDGGDHLLTLALEESVFRYAVHKGSIAIDGVSLTVIDPRADRTIRITIVPHTLRHTIIGQYKVGTRVNVEADMIGKYVEHFLVQAGRLAGGEQGD